MYTSKNWKQKEKEKEMYIFIGVKKLFILCYYYYYYLYIGFVGLFSFQNNRNDEFIAIIMYPLRTKGDNNHILF